MAEIDFLGLDLMAGTDIFQPVLATTRAQPTPQAAAHQEKRKSGYIKIQRHGESGRHILRNWSTPIKPPLPRKDRPWARGIPPKRNFPSLKYVLGLRAAEQASGLFPPNVAGSFYAVGPVLPEWGMELRKQFSLWVALGSPY